MRPAQVTGVHSAPLVMAPAKAPTDPGRAVRDSTILAVIVIHLINVVPEYIVICRIN